MFCGKCGAQVPEGSEFCGVCGARMETTQGGGQSSGLKISMGGNNNGGGYTPPVQTADTYTPPVQPPVQPTGTYTPPPTYVNTAPKPCSPVRMLFTILLAIVVFVVGFADSLLILTRTFINNTIVNEIMDTVDYEAEFGVENFKGKDDVNEIVERMVRQLISYAVDGERPEGLTDEDIDTIIEIYEENTGEKVADASEIELIYDLSEDAMDEFLDELENSSEWQDVIMVARAISINNIIILSVAVAVLILLMLLIRGSLGGTMKVTGVVSVIMALPYFVLPALGSFIKEATMNEVQGSDAAELTMGVLSGFLSTLATFGVVLLVAGIALIVVGSIVKKSKNKKTCYTM